MAERLVQRVGSKDYVASYQVEGDKVVVELDGARREEQVGFRPPLYQARDLLRELVRDQEAKAAA